MSHPTYTNNELEKKPNSFSLTANPGDPTDIDSLEGRLALNKQLMAAIDHLGNIDNKVVAEAREAAQRNYSALTLQQNLGAVMACAGVSSIGIKGPPVACETPVAVDGSGDDSEKRKLAEDEAVRRLRISHENQLQALAGHMQSLASALFDTVAEAFRGSSRNV